MLLFSLEHSIPQISTELREEVRVKFPKRSGKSCLPEEYHEVESRIKDKKWESEEMLEDIQREQALLDKAKFTFEMKKQEFVQFLAQTSQCGPIQVQPLNIC